MGTHKQTTTLSGQGRWSLVIAQEQDPWKWLHRVIGSGNSTHLMPSLKCGPRNLCQVSQTWGQCSGSWCTWDYPQTVSLNPWGSAEGPNWLIASGTALACISYGISVNQLLSTGCSKAWIGLSSWSKSSEH